ncbi:hypothetical protein BGZ60DRAFT_423544 [Tricladium varicosporioides]|nr:hypothetical protein BGZ60DRAFT_423544 [Hymenoscyphus varicosporioides]
MDLATLDNLTRRRKKALQYKSYAKTLLQIATFSGALTFSAVYITGPQSSQGGITVLLYASSILIGSVLGCAALLAFIDLDVSLWVIKLVALMLGLLIFSAFYLLLIAIKLLTGINGPLICGSVIYGVFLIPYGIFTMLDLMGYALNDLPKLPSRIAFEEESKQIMQVEDRRMEGVPEPRTHILASAVQQAGNENADAMPEAVEHWERRARYKEFVLGQSTNGAMCAVM